MCANMFFWVFFCFKGVKPEHSNETLARIEEKLEKAVRHTLIDSDLEKLAQYAIYTDDGKGDTRNLGSKFYMKNKKIYARIEKSTAKVEIDKDKKEIVVKLDELNAKVDTDFVIKRIQWLLIGTVYLTVWSDTIELNCKVC